MLWLHTKLRLQRSRFQFLVHIGTESRSKVVLAVPVPERDVPWFAICRMDSLAVHIVESLFSWRSGSFRSLLDFGKGRGSSFGI